MNIDEKIIVENIKDPTAPEIVLFGLILVNLGPLKIFPKINPPISEATQAIIKENMIISDCLKIVSKKNKILNEKI